MVSLSLSLAFIFASAYIDYEHLRDKDYIESHSSRVYLRGIYFLTLALFSWTGALGGVFLFGALFDGVLNKLRGKDLFYIGNTAVIDKFWNNKLFLYVCAKVLFLGLGIYLTLI